MNKDAIITVISDKAQYDALIQKYNDISKIQIFCDDPAFYYFLQKKGINFIPIEHEDIKEEWEDITFWGCEKALFSKDEIKYDDIFGGVNIECVFYAWLSYYLSTLLILYLQADNILKTYRPIEILLFDNIANLDFPRWNTNYFLTLFIGYLAKKSSINCTQIHLNYKSSLAKDVSLRNVVRKIIDKLHTTYALCRYKRFTPHILAQGTSAHLTGVLRGLKKKGEETFFYDREFQLANFKFYRNLGIKYITTEYFLANNSKRISDCKNTYKKDFGKFVLFLESMQWFSYKGIDLSPIICKEILNSSDKYISDVANCFVVYSGMIEKFDVKKVILTDDFTVLNSYMAAFFRSKGVKVYCISHGFPSLKQHIPNFSLKILKKRFFHSETLVQSAYEKELYVKWGWDEKHLHVTGMPRYDRLADLKPTPFLGRAKERKMRVLYCASGPFKNIKVLTNYPGENYATTSPHEEYCFHVLAQALKGLKVQLIIKPHYVTDEFFWQEYIKHLKYDVDILLTTAANDFLDLLKTSDLLVTGYSSTAIVESALLGVPAIMIYYRDPSYLCPLAKKTLAFGIRNPEDLRDILQKIYHSFLNGQRYPSLSFNREELEFLIGKNDGKNTSRVINYIHES